MTEHYFTTPSDDERRRRIRATLFGTTFELQTANAVFSGDGLDLATGVLLRSVDPPTGTPHVLDLGCGWGPIAIGLAHACPGATVDAIDVNDRALALTRDNAIATGVADRVRVLRPEQVPDEVRYDEIWSNPPIRIGKEALHELLLQWLGRLKPDGRAYLVVGKNLGADSLQRWLTEQGHRCERLASAKGFRVLAADAAVGTT
ncbi:class I SAM-dependent methyltransferase [Enemella sp. A6]|uniref:class I SAM-dependent methyltransferase n=1 Tax=Enemella sp. A6 TaxID=3440152 RepID=UPI003EB727EB